MSEEKKEDLNYQFVSLVFSLQQAAMTQLGKIANPVTGKMEKNLIQAKATIDILEMLKEKSEGNLTDTEQKTMLNALDNLYLNYADEVGKGAATTEATKETAKPAEEEKPATRSADEAGAEAQKEKPAEETEKKVATTEPAEKPAEGAEKKPKKAAEKKEEKKGKETEKKG